MKECNRSVLQPFLDEIQVWTSKTKIDVVLPTAFVEDDKVYNTGFWFTPNGNHQFYKLGLTESEKKFFSIPPSKTQKIFQKGDYNFGILICYEAEHQPWTYFTKDSVDIILWPGYWGWTPEMEWSAQRDVDKINPIFQNMTQWQCPLLQSNFAKNNLVGHNGPGPEGLSFILSSDNELVYKGPHLKEDGIVVKLKKEGLKVKILDCRSL